LKVFKKTRAKKREREREGGRRRRKQTVTQKRTEKVSYNFTLDILQIRKKKPRVCIVPQHANVSIGELPTVE
jgi:hypothetical protein